MSNPAASFFGDIAKAGKKIGDVLEDIVLGAAKVKQVYSVISGPTIAASLAVFYDVVKAVAAGTAAAGAAEVGNVPGAVALSEQTLGMVKSLIADSKVEVSQIKADFEMLGIKI